MAGEQWCGDVIMLDFVREKFSLPSCIIDFAAQKVSIFHKNNNIYDNPEKCKFYISFTVIYSLERTALLFSFSQT